VTELSAVLNEPLRGGAADLWTLSATGRERLAMLGRNFPYPPYAHLLGVRVADVGANGTVMTMPATGWLLSPQGRIPLGMLAALADCSLGSALETCLAAGALYTTSELALQRVGAAGPGGEIRATSEVIYRGADLALTQTSLDIGGRLLAYGTSRLTMLEPIGDLSPLPDPLPTIETSNESPDPWERPAPAFDFDSNVWDSLTGLEIVQRQIKGELPLAPLVAITGIQQVEADEGTVRVTMPANAWLANHFGTIHGGFIAALADSALQLAVQTVTDAAHRFAPLDLKVNYLRPAHPDNTELTARASVVHRGRSIAIASGEVTNAAGKTVAMATGSSMFGPKELLERGRPLEAIDPDPA
jgi:uncharacterized protein (TIGR00369 family)